MQFEFSAGRGQLGGAAQSTASPLLPFGPMSSPASHPSIKQNSSPSEMGSDLTQRTLGDAIPSADNQQTVISQRPPLGTAGRHSDDSGTRGPSSSIQAGTRLGDIELIEHIGGGGMGQVFRGEDKRLGRAVAVKVLSCDQSSDQDSVRRFLNEAKSAARLNHQNIAQVYSAGEWENHPYIVFEFVEGANLRTMIEEQGPLMLEEALSYTLQIADALAHASDRRIVHRDVKPSNVLIAPNGLAKLIDLGLARLSTGQNPDGDLTASGVTLGTFDYISPEQARDPRNADSRSDIYSLGCTLFYMLAGRPPFPEGTVLQKLLQHQGDEPPDICQFRPDLPEEISMVLGKMMAKDPRRRYPDSARLMEALLALADQIGLRPAGPTQAIWLPPHESRISTLHRQTPWLAPTLILASLTIGLHLIWSAHGEVDALRDFRNLGEQAGVEQPAPKGPPVGPVVVETLPVNSSVLQLLSQAEAGSMAVSGSNETVIDGDVSNGSLSPVEPRADSALPSQPRSRGGRGLNLPSAAASLGPRRQSAGISVLSLLGAVTPGSLSYSAATSPEANPASASDGNPGATPSLVMVHPNSADSSQYASVGEALAAQPDAELIELDFDGPNTEKPWTLGNRHLLLRAAPGRTPVVVFQPTGTDPILCPRDMIQVSGGRLTVESVSLEMDIPRDIPSESWALVRLLAGGRVAFRNCSLRLRNASDGFGSYHRDVAFFRASPRDNATMTLPDPMKLDRTPDIELDNCLVCGEACFVRLAESLPFQVTWHNGLLATSEAAFWIGGSSRTPSHDTTVGVDLQQVTAVTGGALLHLALAAHRPHIAPLRFSVSSCATESHPLILASGAITPSDELLNRLTWNCRSSVFQGGSPPLSFVDASGEAIRSERMDKWLETAGLASSLPQRIWQGVAGEGPMHSMEPNDYLLNLAEAGIPVDTVPAPGFLPREMPAGTSARPNP
ncbi:MAG: serine/threonine-protein kinase [Thermoguttaceae bacterium]